VQWLITTYCEESGAQPFEVMKLHMPLTQALHELDVLRVPMVEVVCHVGVVAVGRPPRRVCKRIPAPWQFARLSEEIEMRIVICHCLAAHQMLTPRPSS
jgi:hypothetical protein